MSLANPPEKKEENIAIRIIGNMISVSVIAWIPAVAIYRLYNAVGSNLKEVGLMETVSFDGS